MLNLRVIKLIVIAVLTFTSLCCGVQSVYAHDDDLVVYASLDEAIDAEIEGIDFSDLDDVADFSIRGSAKVPHEHMAEFVRQHNPSFDPEIARTYIEVGRIYGIRGDIAFCQAILETGWFRFDRGTAVQADHHNYCGLGVVRRGVKGAGFKTVRQGVTAHFQHLYAYATRDRLPDGEKMVDPRFNAVKRGVAVEWSDLNNRWAMNRHYGSKILAIYDALKIFSQGSAKKRR